MHRIAAFAVLISAAHAAQPALPEKGPADSPVLLDVEKLPPLPPAPESFEEVAPAAKPAGTREQLRAAADRLRKKAAAFRAGKCTKTELRAAAAEVNTAARAYRASLARK